MDFMSFVRGFDIRFFWIINDAHNPALDMFFAAFTHLGSGWVAVPVIVLIIALKRPRRAYVHLALFIALSMTVAGVGNSQVKSLVKRPRPITCFSQQRAPAIAHGETFVAGPGSRALVPHVVGPQLKHRSFPSGHTNTAFSAATVLCLLLGGWWALAYVLAAGVGYSRVYMGVHFPLDAVGGAMMGVAVVAGIYFLYCKYVKDLSDLK